MEGIRALLDGSYYGLSFKQNSAREGRDNKGVNVEEGRKEGQTIRCTPPRVVTSAKRPSQTVATKSLLPAMNVGLSLGLVGA